jgi:hypothetical protein
MGVQGFYYTPAVDANRLCPSVSGKVMKYNGEKRRQRVLPEFRKGLIDASLNDLIFIIYKLSGNSAYYASQRLADQLLRDILPGSWNIGPAFHEQVGLPVDNGDGTETVTVRIPESIQESADGRAFIRLSIDNP